MADKVKHWPSWANWYAMKYLEQFLTVLFGILFISVPLALWKIFDIAVWLVNNISIG